MLSINEIAWYRSLLKCHFNTSNVINQQFHNLKSYLYIAFQYIKCYQSTYNCPTYNYNFNIFQYIKCYQSTINSFNSSINITNISIHQMLSINGLVFLRSIGNLDNFNTSNVINQPPIWGLYLSSPFYFNTSNVINQQFIEEVFEFKTELFQYIKCYQST